MEKTKALSKGKGLAALLTDAPGANAPSLVFINLLQISPSKLNPREEFDEAELNELAESIKKLGVIQAITVRPDADGYEIVCGERRVRASELAGLTTIPATVRNLTDAQALECMITENLQRKDVHPLGEAKSFQLMLDKMNYTTIDIAAKIGKAEPFVVRRLQLTRLIPELKEAFKKNELGIGHAELLSRISDQHQLLWYKEVLTHSYSPGQGNLQSLKNWLNNKTERKLAGAPFKVDAPYEGKQYVSARCTVCRLNSAFNNTLFPDTADQAICHDANCFQAKCNADFNERLQAAIDDPEIVLVDNDYGNDAYRKKMESDGHIVLHGWESYETVRKPDKKSYLYQGDGHADIYAKALEKWKSDLAKSKKAFIIAGTERGSFIQVLVKDKKLAAGIAGSNPSLQRRLLVEDVEQKRKRGREIDREKVMKKVVDHIRELPVLKSVYNETLQDQELNAITAMCFEKCGGDEIKKLLGVPANLYSAGHGPEIIEMIAKAPVGLKLMIIRKGLFNSYNSIYPQSMSGGILYELASVWCQDEVNAIWTEQDGVKQRREAKLDQKIKDFDKQKQPAEKA